MVVMKYNSWSALTIEISFSVSIDLVIKAECGPVIIYFNELEDGTEKNKFEYKGQNSEFSGITKLVLPLPAFKSVSNIVRIKCV